MKQSERNKRSRLIAGVKKDAAAHGMTVREMSVHGGKALVADKGFQVLVWVEGQGWHELGRKVDVGQPLTTT